MLLVTDRIVLVSQFPGLDMNGQMSLLLYYQVSGVVNAEYELEYLLLEGHCFDVSTGQPPRGLQFTLGMRQEPLMHDTIVMANLVSLFSLLCLFGIYVAFLCMY